jgi:hypothetical protein
LWYRDDDRDADVVRVRHGDQAAVALASFTWVKDRPARLATRIETLTLLRSPVADAIEVSGGSRRPVPLGRIGDERQSVSSASTARGLDD